MTLLVALVLTLNIAFSSAQIPNTSVSRFNSIRPTIRLGAPTHQINSEHISLNFYNAAARADQSKSKLQRTLHNFLENLQRNLTTSTVLNTIVNTIDVEKTQRQLRKLNELSLFFQTASELSAMFASETENLFEAAKNESNDLLLKLRHVPSAQRFLPTKVKLHLTDYFAEMEFFHVLLSEVVDVAMEYIVGVLHSTQRTFIRYADIQRDVLRNWNFNPDEWCCNRYMDFLQQWSAQIFKCATGHELNTAYDVYAMTEVTIKHILQQLEFRIQRLFNCFLFGNYEIRCRFLRHAEHDFEKLFAKLEELQMYYDIKTQRGRVTNHYHRRRRSRSSEATNTPDDSIYELEIQDKCIPYGFPDTQMLRSLKACFYFPQFN